MTLCPIAIVSSCRKCPAFTVCPLKSVLGDHVKEVVPTRSTATSAVKGARKR